MKWKRVLLVYPYGKDKKSEFLYNRLMMIPPLGLEVIATAIKDAVDDLVVVDLRVETEPLPAIIKTFRPDLIGISINWGTDKYVDEMIHSLPRWCEDAGLPRDTDIIAGGLHVTRDADDTLTRFPEIKMLVMGYGEATTKQLIQAGSPRNIDSIYWRRNGDVVRNPIVRHLDVNSFRIDRSFRRYTYPSLHRPGDSVLTSIGCPMRCAFCKWRENIYGDVQPWVPRSAEDVVREFEEIDSDRIYLADANFAGNLNRVEEICDLILERKIKKLFTLEIRVNSIAARPALIRKMERAGFFMFLIGIESPHDRLLRQLNKGFNQRVIRKAFDALRPTKILTLGNFIIGSIGESKKDMLYIADFAKEIGVDFISPNKLYAYPGSEFAEFVNKTPGYHIDSGRRHYVYSDWYDIKALRDIQYDIYRRFYTPSHIWSVIRKMTDHPVVRRLGSGRLFWDLLCTVGGNFTSPRFRRRLIKKVTKRFKSTG
jgi:radical SAM superfamily enzyme YgiQ (UPF0313 family)